jgi:hypothetical protein
MVEIMRHQEELFDESGLAKRTPADARKMALGIMHVTNATSLLVDTVHMLKHNSKLAFPAVEGVRYISTLSGQVLCMIGEEAPAMNAGDVWMLTNSEALLINKSGDDAIVLNVVVKPE